MLTLKDFPIQLNNIGGKNGRTEQIEHKCRKH